MWSVGTVGWDWVVSGVFSNLTDSVVLYNGNALVLAEKRAVQVLR